MADQLLSAHADWSTWWDHSWQSATPWFPALHCDNHLQSHDWTTSPSQPRQTLVQNSTPVSSTIAASQLPHTRNVRLGRLHADVWLVSGRLHTDSPAHLHSVSGGIYSGCSTMCGLQRCIHIASHKPSTETRGHQHLHSISRNSSHRSTTPVSQAQRDVPPPPCLSRPADQPEYHLRRNNYRNGVVLILFFELIK